MSKKNIEIENNKYFEALLEFNKILSNKQDLKELLTTILFKAVEVTSADSGSLLLAENSYSVKKEGVIPSCNTSLKFHFSINNSKEFQFIDKVMPINKNSIAGYSFLSGKILRIDDCYSLKNNLPYAFNSDYDKKNGYKTRSMLTVPLRTFDGEIVGVFQLINKKKDKLKSSKNNISKEIINESFSAEDEKIVTAFSHEAATAIKNLRLIEEKKEQFKSFIKACVTAIDTRDPSNSGHSARVAKYTVMLAQEVNKQNKGRFKNVIYSRDEIYEIKVAALLHDFGKIVVRESIFRKSKKLFHGEMKSILSRIEVAKFKYAKIAWQNFIDEITCYNYPLQKIMQMKSQINQNIETFNEKLDLMNDTIQKINEPRIVEEKVDINTIIKWVQEIFHSLQVQILSVEEIEKLSIQKGSLTPIERVEMETHAYYTYKFLSRISWSKELEKVPYIAAGHHEKLDGSGYPNKLKGDEIPLPVRMMTIADMFDSLTSSDRPYKKAIDFNKAISILKTEAKQGKLDNDLLEIFINKVVNIEKSNKAA